MPTTYPVVSAESGAESHQHTLPLRERAGDTCGCLDASPACVAAFSTPRFALGDGYIHPSLWLLAPSPGLSFIFSKLLLGKYFLWLVLPRSSWRSEVSDFGTLSSPLV